MSAPIENFGTDTSNDRTKPVFEAKNLLDGRLMVSDSLDFGVLKSGQNVNYYSEKSASNSSSGQTFNSVMNLSTIIDRRIMWRNEWVITLVGTPGNGAKLVQIGSGATNFGISAFPAHQYCQNQTCSINNASVTFPTRDSLPILIKMLDKKTLDLYCQSAPNCPDFYYNMLNDSAQPNGSYGDCDYMSFRHNPNGAFPMVITGNTAGDGATEKTVVIKFTTSEPLLMSPFLADMKSHNGQGLYGVSNIRFQMNFGDTSRLLRMSSALKTLLDAGSVTVNINNSYLDYTLITPHPSLKLPLRNVVPYCEINRYVTPASITLGVCPTDGSALTTVQLQSASFQLPSIPDKLAIMIRPSPGIVDSTVFDVGLQIQKISVNFANQSGLLSNASTYNLYNMSKRNGSTQTWAEYFGNVNNNDGGYKYTVGSLLLLEFGTDIQINDDFYSCGSIGSFQLNVQLTVANANVVTALNSADYQIMMLGFNSGFLVTEMGSSSIYSGVLDKETVMNASLLPPSSSHLSRVYGGGWWSSFKKGLKKAWKTVAPVVKPLGSVVRAGLSLVPHPAAKTASGLMGAVGLGKGAGYSAGGKGKRPSLRDRLHQ